MTRRDSVDAHVESLLRSIGRADLTGLGMHKNRLRARMEKALKRDVKLRGSELICTPDPKRPGGSTKRIGGEDGIDDA